MDQKKIGRFIAQLRKEKNLTQKEVSERLAVSEKTVSKWECGNGLPEVVYMEPLCNILGITVNELLAGEHLSITGLLRILDMFRLELMKQLEFEQLRFRIYRLYGIEIDSLEMSDNGAGSMTYFVTADKQKYVVKYASDNEMNHPEREPGLCRYLCAHGIPASQFIENIQGKFLSFDENGRRFHVQGFIEGVVYSYNEAPDFLLEQAPVLLAEIHEVLKSYEELPEGIGATFFQERRPESMIESFQSSLKLAVTNGDSDNADDIYDIIDIINHFPDYTFDISRFTCGNTHGDYMISQLVCEDNSIRGIIDWTTACRHPLVWEVVRSYIFMAPECKDGNVDINRFERYLRAYMKKGKLNAYDIEEAGNLFYYFLAVCDFYSQYYSTFTKNRFIYLEQAKLCKKVLEWFSRHIEELNARLKAIAAENEKN